MNHISEYSIKSVGRGFALAGFGIALLATPARSQESSNTAIQELDAFTVVATRFELPIHQVGSTVDVLDSYELRKGQDVFLVDALREVPGLVMRNNGGAGGVFGITLRGLSSNRPKVLVNGIEMSNPSNGAMINLGNLFTGAASRVEVLRGPQSSLYGADALAGVISIDTVGGSEGGRAFVGYGSYDTYDYGLGHSGSQGGFSWSVDALLHESEGISTQSPSYGPAWADDDTYDNTTLSSAIQYTISESARVYASALYLDTYSEFDPGDPAWVWGVPGGDDYATTEQLFGRVGGAFQHSDNWSSSANISYSDVETLSYTDGSEYFADGERYKYDWVNKVGVNDAWTLVAGVEYDTEENLSDVGNRHNTSVFFENALSLSEQLDVTLGGRYDDNSAYGEEATYRATFSYRIDSMDARLRGSVGSSFQAPSFYQLFNQYYGNQNLKAESGTGWDFGFEKSFAEGKVSVSSTLFGNEVTDKIIWDSIYSNVDTYRSVGVENTVRYFVSDSLRLKAAYTYSDAEENGSIEALRVPRNVGTVGFDWTSGDGKLGINVNALFVSSQFGDNGSRSANEKLGGYEVLNVATTYQLNEQYTLWLRVGNVLDKNYEEISGYQTAGANAQVGARMKF